MRRGLFVLAVVLSSNGTAVAADQASLEKAKNCAVVMGTRNFISEFSRRCSSLFPDSANAWTKTDSAYGVRNQTIFDASIDRAVAISKANDPSWTRENLISEMRTKQSLMIQREWDQITDKRGQCYRTRQLAEAGELDIENQYPGAVRSCLGD